MERTHFIAFTGLLFLALLLGFCGFASAEIIIVNETKEQLYALSDVTLSGDLDSNFLSIAGSGEVITGQDVKVYLFGPASDVLVDNVVIGRKQVPVSFDGKGYFFVVNGGKFAFTGELKVRTPGQVRLYVPGPMNELKFDLQHGYPIGGDKYGLYGNEVIIQRSGKVATLVDGSFRFTYADRNDFYYVVRYRSFGKSLGREIIMLPNGESVISVVGAKDYSVQGGSLILELEGSEASVAVSGTFGSNSLRAPLSEGMHHVLIESDPEKKITISTDAKEIDLKESTLPSTYGNARAFLASNKNQFTIIVKVLDKYPSLAASVGSATNNIAITEKGSMLGELRYIYSNTGVDYIELDAPGTPLYAATGYGTPVKLTKEDNKLFLSFPKTGSGSGTLDMIYFKAGEALKPFGLVEVPVVNTVLPVTQQTTTIFLPSDYTVLYTFGARGGSELPELKSVILFAIIMGGLAYGIRGRMGFVAPYVVFTAGLVMFDGILFAVAVIISIVLVIKKHIERKALGWMMVGAGVLVALCLALIVFVAILQMGIFNMGGGPSYSTARIQSDYAEVEKAAQAPMARSMNLLGDGSGAISVPQREGVLPVRLELPRLGKTITVTNHLVTKENPVKLSVLIVANWLSWIFYAISLASGAAAFKAYGR